MGSFEAWSRAIGGILEYTGVRGFLENAAELYEEADAEALQWEGFLQVLQEVFYDEPFTTAEFVEKLNAKTWDAEKRTNEPTAQAVALRAALPDVLAGAADRDGSLKKCAGKCFGERVGRRFGESQVRAERAGVTHHAQRWRVRDWRW